MKGKTESEKQVGEKKASNRQEETSTMAEREGQQLGNYRLLKLLGQGGSARVYLGEHVHLGTQAAIKLLEKRLVKDEEVVFQQEASTLANLVHPNIVRVLDFNIESGTNMPYLVMDYAPGGSLRIRHPRGTRLPLLTVVEYIKQVVAALQYAHDQGVIHRDVKPENMLIGRNGEIQLSDFGLAVILHSQHIAQNNQADTGGTSYYMAPEMFQSEPQTASDQYSLGIVVYEWLCGTVPYPESNAIAPSSQQIHPPLPSLYTHDATIPSAVEQVVLTALAKRQEKRFDSVGDFAAALESAITTPSAPEQSETVTPRDISRRAMLLSACGVVGVGLVGTGIWLAANTILSQHPSPRNTPTPQPQGMLYLTYRRHTSNVYAVAWSPDGKRIASASGGHAANSSQTVQVWDAANGGNAFTYRGHSSTVTAVAWSPNSMGIASGSWDQTVQVWDAANGGNVFIYRGHSSTVTAVAWSPNSMSIASGSVDYTVQVWDVTNGSVFIYRGHSTTVNTVAWSPDGKRIASGSYDKTMQVWDAANGDNAFTYRGHSSFVDAVAWSPDSLRIASGSADKTVQVWQA
jgi:eukaryotic-like serine/threonine-protein kinase